MATATLPEAPVRKTTRAQIDKFLAERRIAIVGLSRHPQDFTRHILREFVKHGYDVVPVHPQSKVLAGRTCFARVQDIQPPVTAALLLTRPEVTEQVVRDCAVAKINHVWMHKGGGTGAVSNEAVAFCRQRGMNVVAGECPMMFLEPPEFVHRVHGFVKKVMGKYPK
jgi:predicted CoA-binding protein